MEVGWYNHRRVGSRVGLDYKEPGGCLAGLCYWRTTDHIALAFDRMQRSSLSIAPRCNIHNH